MSKPSPSSVLYRLIAAGQLAHQALLIPLKERGRAKKRLMSLRALKDLEAWAGA